MQPRIGCGIIGSIAPGRNAEGIQLKDHRLSEVLAQHEKIREQIGSFDIVSEELQVMDAVQNAGDWVKSQTGEGKEALVKLKRLLWDLERGLKVHFQHEDQDLIPFLKDNGQTDFANLLLSEHAQIDQRLMQYGNTAGKLAQANVRAGIIRRETKNLSNAIANLFELIEKHAAREEEMVFQIGHGA